MVLKETKWKLILVRILFIVLNWFTNIPCYTSKGSSKILKTLQNLEISHLNVERTSINIWVPLSLSHNFLYFSQVVHNRFSKRA